MFRFFNRLFSANMQFEHGSGAVFCFNVIVCHWSRGWTLVDTQNSRHETPRRIHSHPASDSNRLLVEWLKDWPVE